MEVTRCAKSTRILAFWHGPPPPSMSKFKVQTHHQRVPWLSILLRAPVDKMSKSTDPGHFFQTDASESTRARRAAKSGNKNGNPIVLSSKILSAVPDPFSSACIYIAESAGCVRRVNIEVRGSIHVLGCRS